MSFIYRNNELHAENVPVTALAERYGTPCYIYSRSIIEQQWQAFRHALANYPHLICYAVKANSNIGLLNILAQLGAGFDIVSGGELARVIAAKGNVQQTIFAGVGKSQTEITQALAADIYCFNVESASELFRIQTIAKQLNKSARIALRINPDIAVDTHHYIATGLKHNKFGIAIDAALPLYQEAKKLSHIQCVGISCHLGSQITELTPFLAALDQLLQFIDQLAATGIALQHIDLGGGLGVCYQNEQPPSISDYIQAILMRLKNRHLKLVLEPGRALLANAGILLTRIEYIKTSPEKNFAIVDAAMNDFMRPALYQAWQTIIPVNKLTNATPPRSYDVVGPVCETSDFLGQDRSLAINENDLLAVMQTGAYGFSMSSNYNSRPRVAEVMVDGDQSYLIRRRETVEELFSAETIL